MTESVRIHVCSLSTSALPRIEKSIKETEDAHNKLRLKWLNVAMKYNMQTQLQSLYTHLGSKEKHPKFRAIRMRTFWRQWKRQTTRDDWHNIFEDLRHKNVLNQIHFNKVMMDRQRSEIAARNFVNNPLAQFSPIEALFTNKPVNYLYLYENSAACRPGLANQEIDFLTSSAVRTLSEAPTMTDDNESRK
jgi:hypothetical protein